MVFPFDMGFLMFNNIWLFRFGKVVGQVDLRLY